MDLGIVSPGETVIGRLGPFNGADGNPGQVTGLSAALFSADGSSQLVSITTGSYNATLCCYPFSLAVPVDADGGIYEVMISNGTTNIGGLSVVGPTNIQIEVSEYAVNHGLSPEGFFVLDVFSTAEYHSPYYFESVDDNFPSFTGRYAGTGGDAYYEIYWNGTNWVFDNTITEELGPTTKGDPRGTYASGTVVSGIAIATIGIANVMQWLGHAAQADANNLPIVSPPASDLFNAASLLQVPYGVTVTGDASFAGTYLPYEVDAAHGTPLLGLTAGDPTFQHNISYNGFNWILTPNGGGLLWTGPVDTPIGTYVLAAHPPATVTALTLARQDTLVAGVASIIAAIAAQSGATPEQVLAEVLAGLVAYPAAKPSDVKITISTTVVEG